MTPKELALASILVGGGEFRTEDINSENNEQHSRIK